MQRVLAACWWMNLTFSNETGKITTFLEVKWLLSFFQNFITNNFIAIHSLNIVKMDIWGFMAEVNLDWPAVEILILQIILSSRIHSLQNKLEIIKAIARKCAVFWEPDKTYLWFVFIKKPHHVFIKNKSKHGELMNFFFCLSLLGLFCFWIIPQH